MTVSKVATVPVVHWNPRTPVTTAWPANKIRLGRRINNFGDMLGPLLAAWFVAQERGDATIERPRATLEPPFEVPDRLSFRLPGQPSRLLAVGSIMHLARAGDVVWGSGVNAKKPLSRIPSTLDVRAVRGPRTQAILRDLGIACPDVFGDPGVLIPELMDGLGWHRPSVRHDVCFVPNMHDYPAWRQNAPKGVTVVDPTWPLNRVVSAIASSRAVIASSLHGVVTGEAFASDVRWVKADIEPDMKYQDYFEGTERFGLQPYSTVEEALRGESLPPLERDSVVKRLTDVFPEEMWKGRDL